MATVINSALILLSVCFIVLIIAEYLKTKDLRLFLFQFFGLAVFLLILSFSTGFPKTSARSFGTTGISTLWGIGIMFVSTLLGIAAHYFYYLKRSFTWKGFLKPIIISPIIFLPLIGSVQGLPYLESMQTISFCILAFQNGFFWKAVFERAQSNT